MLNKNLQASIWYSSYIQTYLERDIRNIYNIGSIRDFQRFLTILASRCAQILNLSALSNDIGVSLNTIKKWISILEASRIIFLLPAYYNNFGKRITKMSKVYFTDCGLICYLTGIKSRDHLLNGPMGGALFENFCIQETLKIFLNNALRPSMYYIRTNNSLEVDLIIETAYQTIFPIEIKLTKTVKSAMALPIEKINRIFPKLNFQKGRVISLSKSQTKLTSFVSNQNLDDYFIWLEGLCKRD